MRGDNLQHLCVFELRRKIYEERFTRRELVYQIGGRRKKKDSKNKEKEDRYEEIANNRQGGRNYETEEDHEKFAFSKKHPTYW